MLFAYLGPEPRPLLPRWDGFVAEGTIRMLGRALIPVNWLQAMENSLDPIHTEWLHGHAYEFVKEKEGVKVAISTRHEKIAFREFEYGITKHRLARRTFRGLRRLAGRPSGCVSDHAFGRQRRRKLALLCLPNSRAGRRYPYHAYVVHGLYAAAKGADVPQHLLEKVHVYEVPWKDENGEFIVDNIDGQDMMAWITQGAIADRTERESRRVRSGHRYLPRAFCVARSRRSNTGTDPIVTIRDASPQPENRPAERA